MDAKLAQKSQPATLHAGLLFGVNDFTATVSSTAMQHFDFKFHAYRGRRCLQFRYFDSNPPVKIRDT